MCYNNCNTCNTFLIKYNKIYASNFYYKNVLNNVYYLIHFCNKQ